MEVKCPEQFRTFEYEGATYNSTPTGIAEIEHRDGVEVFVEKYGIMHTFDPPNPPPKHVFREFQFSSLCRSFMAGSMSTMKLQLKELMEEPITVDKTEKGGLLRKNRIAVENGLLDAHQLDELAARSGCDDYVLHNPTKTTIKMLKKRGVTYSKIVFHGSAQERREGTPENANYERYKNFLQSFLRQENFQFDILPDGSTDDNFFYYGGFSNLVHRRHKNFISLELSPYAYKASSRIFDSLEEREDGLYYRISLRKDGILQNRHGHYPYEGRHYRYQPDVVASKYSKPGQKWGLYGILSSISLAEFSASSRASGVGKVTHSTMYAAYVLPARTIRDAKRYVATNLNCRTLTEVSNMLRRHEKLDAGGVKFRANRFFMFRGSGYVLDTGERYHFVEDPDGEFLYRRTRYRTTTGVENSTLTIAIDPYGNLTYQNRPARAIWNLLDPYFMNLTPSVNMIDFTHAHTHYYDMRVHTRPIFEDEID